jgi:putative flippase GtrA
MTEPTSTDSCWEKPLAEIRRRVHQRQFWQDVRATQVAAEGMEKNEGTSADFSGGRCANARAADEVGTTIERRNSILHNTSASENACEFEHKKSAKKSDAEDGNPAAPSRFVRFSKFNFVGGIGIGVQFAALFILKSVLHLNYLLATALAVETAVLHNFVWHERFTWAERVMRERTRPWCRRSLARLVRFHLGNGAVSILGNLALMKLLVGQGHMNYLVANAIAITLCSLANFLVSDGWVFEE